MVETRLGRRSSSMRITSGAVALPNPAATGLSRPRKRARVSEGERSESGLFAEAVEELVEDGFGAGPSTRSRKKRRGVGVGASVEGEGQDAVSPKVKAKGTKESKTRATRGTVASTSKAASQPTAKSQAAPSSKSKSKPKPLSYDPSSFPPRVSSPWKVGAHVSAAGGVENAVVNAAMIGANAFALFLKPQRTWTSSPLSQESIALFKQRMAEFGYDPKHVLPHGSYLVNLGGPDAEKRAKSYACFVDDLKRCEALGLKYYNFQYVYRRPRLLPPLHPTLLFLSSLPFPSAISFHPPSPPSAFHSASAHEPETERANPNSPGSTLGQTTREASIAHIARCLNDAHREVEGVVTVLENMAGAGHVLGATFEDLRDIIALVDVKERVGVCLDTCHAYAAGYDISTKEGWEKTMTHFDRTIGLRYLAGMHLNDSQTGCGSRRDRHANLGMGTLPLESFRAILTDPRTRDIPLVLETPTGERPGDVWGVEVGVCYALSRLEAGSSVGLGREEGSEGAEESESGGGGKDDGGGGLRLGGEGDEGGKGGEMGEGETKKTMEELAGDVRRAVGSAASKEGMKKKGVVKKSKAKVECEEE